jgi:hypothetical protein
MAQRLRHPPGLFLPRADGAGGIHGIRCATAPRGGGACRGRRSVGEEVRRVIVAPRPWLSQLAAGSPLLRLVQ